MIFSETLIAAPKGSEDRDGAAVLSVLPNSALAVSWEDCVGKVVTRVRGIAGMLMTGENRSTWRKSWSTATLSTTNPTSGRARMSAVNGRRLTAWTRIGTSGDKRQHKTTQGKADRSELSERERKNRLYYMAVSCKESFRIKTFSFICLAGGQVLKYFPAYKEFL